MVQFEDQTLLNVIDWPEKVRKVQIFGMENVPMLYSYIIVIEAYE